MRTIKFRVYIPEHGKFSYFELGNFDYSDRYLDQHDYPVQQFTGSKDANNVDIYEGDLVEFIYANQPDIEDSKGVYEVFYSQKNSAFYLRVHKKNWLDTSFVTQQDAKAKTIDVNCPVQSLTELPLSQFKICKVIGNIFENSELLK
jgi:uncharacterized phage protein (TIGR01671 family)